MAELTGVIQFNGKVGEVVAAKDSQGKMTVRKYNGSPKNPNTPAQVKVRTKFLTSTATASVFKNTLVGLLRTAKTKKLSTTNTFQILNKGAIEVTETNPGEFSSQVDYSKIKLSSGSVEPAIFRRPQSQEGNPLTIESATDDSLANNRRFYYMAAYCPTHETSRISDPVVSTEGKAYITVPQSWNGLEVHLYAYVQEFSSTEEAVEYASYWNTNGGIMAHAWLRAAGEKANYSDTQYLGSMEVGD